MVEDFRVVVFANKVPGAEIIRYLIGTYKHDIAHVFVTEHNSISELCQHEGISTSCYEGEDQAVELIRKLEPIPTYGILAWWPFIIREPLIDSTQKGFINTHNSYLPYCRGMHQNFWALVEEQIYGVSIHYVDRLIDQGDIISQKEIKYDWSDNGGSLHCKSLSEIVQLFRETYPKIRADRVTRSPQEEHKATYHHSTEMHASCILDLDEITTVRRLLNLLRAKTYPGHAGCRFKEHGIEYEVHLTINRAFDSVL